MKSNNEKLAYIVFARVGRRSQYLEMLGIFDSRVAADDFIDQTSVLGRARLEMHTWAMNRFTTDPYWTSLVTQGRRWARRLECNSRS